jgi:hypothetical protein
MSAAMNSGILHPAPAWTAVARAQLRAVAFSLRKESVTLLSLLLIVLLSAVRAAWASRGGSTPNIVVTSVAAAATPMVVLALFLPFSVWRAEDPARRMYHWSMPVGRLGHTLAKVGAGWVWVLLSVAAYELLLLFIVVSNGSTFGRAGPRGVAAWWEWLVPITAATIAYAVGSAAVIGLRHPVRWIAGGVPGLMVLYFFGPSLGMGALHSVLQDVWQGPFGLTTVLGTTLLDESGAPDLLRWSLATLLWGAGSIAITIAAANRRFPES